MKDLYEVLRQKEQEFKRLGKEIEALRVTAALLAEGKPETVSAESNKAAAATSNPSGTRPLAATGVEAGGNGNGWEEAPARWP
jgi:hypothetical protein